MADRHGSVVLLRHPGAASRLPHSETLRTALIRLDELDKRLRELSPQATWSAQRCMIASTPFRMRLTSGRRGLRDLAWVCAISDLAHERWALELNDARREAEGRLADVAVCLHVLHRVDTSWAERERQTEVLASARSDLLEVFTGIRHMLAPRLPVDPDGGEGRA